MSQTWTLEEHLEFSGDKEIERVMSNERILERDVYSEDSRRLGMKKSPRGGTREGGREREDMEDRSEGPENDISDSKWHYSEDNELRTSSRSLERGNERVNRRGTRDKERTGNGGDRSELPKEIASERSARVKKKSGLRKVDVIGGDSEEGRASGRGKRSREDGWRDRSRPKEAGGTPQEDSDDGAKGSGRRRGEVSRGYGPQVRSRAVDEWSEFESAVRPPSRLRTERTEDERIERSSVRDKTDSGREESGDGFRLGGRSRGDKGEDCGVEKSPNVGGERIDEMPETGSYSGRLKGENEGDKQQRADVGRERLERSKGIPENFGKLGGQSRGNDDNKEKLKSGDIGRVELEDGGKASGRRSGGKTLKGSWSSHGRKDTRGDSAEKAWGWNDSEDFEQEKGSGRVGREKTRERNIESGTAYEIENEYSWERERRREWEECPGGPNDRKRDRYREEDDKAGKLLQDLGRKRERAERERSSRERVDEYISDRELLDRERNEGLIGLNGVVLMNESTFGGAASGPLQLTLDPGRGTPSGTSCLPRAGGDSGGPAGEFSNAGGDFDWEGPGQEDRFRGTDGGHFDDRERHSTEDEHPPGLEQVLGPSLGRGGVNDVGMGFNVHGGRGRAKGSPSNRSRGAMLHDGRANFMNNPGTGLMIRGYQPGGKGGRGGRGPAKVARGGSREGQRGNLSIISQLGPGMPGPLFGQLGPPGPIAGLGPGIMGPGGFPLPPFGGRIGWNGGGDMGIMNGPPGPGPGPGPPRFVPGLGPGPPGLVPNMFFNSPGPVRGGSNAISLGHGGNSPFGGRQMPGERGPVEVRSGGRGGGPPGLVGRGPSRGEQNDYSQHFVDTGLRPQNFIRDVELSDRFEEYPKLKELIARKDKLISERATPPMYMQCDLRDIELRPEVFGTKFDVILVDPPWEEYVRRAPGVGDSMEWWSHSEIQNLRIEAISDTPAFIFLWVGDAEGLDQGRLCLKKWGFRRCEDICWVKTNRENPTPALRHDANTLLQHSKEHCLMGIKGTVRRSTDGHIIHANVDTDIIISEEPDYGSTAKPEELYHIIEHFAQGQRRIELFGEDHNIRAGWVTVGKGLSSSNFSPQAYAKHFFDSEGKLWQGGRGNPPSDAPHLVGTTSEIESLRPKSPPPRAQQQPQATAVQPSGANANTKRTFTTSQGGIPNGPFPSLQPSMAPNTIVPLETGPVGSGGRAGNNIPIPKPAESVVPGDTKVHGAQQGIGPVKITNEERSQTEPVEVWSEVDSGLQTHLSKSAEV